MTEVLFVHRFSFLNKDSDRKELEVVFYSTGAVKITTRYLDVQNKSREIFLSEESGRLVLYSLATFYNVALTDEVKQRIRQPLFSKIRLWFHYQILKWNLRK